jgi:hypothetical protein
MPETSTSVRYTPPPPPEYATVPVPDAVLDAAAALASVCRAWPTSTIPPLADATTLDEATDHQTLCQVAAAPHLVDDAVYVGIGPGAVGAILLLLVLRGIWKLLRSFFSTAKGLWEKRADEGSSIKLGRKILRDINEHKGEIR